MSVTTVVSGAAEEVLGKLDNGGGFATVTLRELKDVMGVGRLGTIVLADIRRWLVRNGVGYFPKNVLEGNDQPRQDQELRIYRTDRGSALAAVVAAVLDPTMDGDRVLGALSQDSSTQRAEELEERLERTRAALEDALNEINRGSESIR